MVNGGSGESGGRVMARKDVSGPLPLTAAERQVIQTLRAAEGVASETERLRRTLRHDDVPMRRRAELQAELLDALERLTNLLGVLSGSAADGVSPDFRMVLVVGIAELRERVFAAGVQVLESKLNAIRGEAADVMEGRAFYRMGLGDRMRNNLSQLAFTIEGLGGRDGLPTGLKSCLDVAEKAVDHMLAYERRSQLLPEFA